MSNVSMTFDEAFAKESAPKEMPNAELVEEMCKHLRKEKVAYLDAFGWKLLPQYNINEGGFRRLAVTRDDFERLLRPWKVELGRLVLQSPRNKDETHTDYLRRLRSEVGDSDNWYNRFERIKDLLAHIHRIDNEERAEREREAAAEAQRRRDDEKRRLEARRKLEREASPDEAQIKRLLGVIAEAREIEELMALIDRANEARHALRDMYEKERDACQQLGEPVPERSVPGWPHALGPPPVRVIPLNGEGRHSPSQTAPAIRTAKG